MLVSVLVKGIGYCVTDAEAIMSVISTWGLKINMIVISIATGITISLIPNITSSFVKGDMKDVEEKINKSLSMLLFLVVPMTVGLSILAKPVWTIFYGQSYYGPKVFMISIYVAIFSSLFTNVVVTMQSLGRYKKLYIALFSGFLFNVIMNIPFMVLFHKIGLTIYYGNLVATMIGFGITIILCLIDLKREFKVNYSETFKRWLYIIFSVIIMVVVLKCLNIVLPINGYGRAMSILITGVYSFIGMIIYFGLTYKLQLFQNIIGVDFIKKFINKKKK